VRRDLNLHAVVPRRVVECSSGFGVIQIEMLALMNGSFRRNHQARRHLYCTSTSRLALIDELHKLAPTLNRAL
jgi:hypothetical protein